MFISITLAFFCLDQVRGVASFRFRLGLENFSGLEALKIGNGNFEVFFDTVLLTNQLSIMNNKWAQHKKFANMSKSARRRYFPLSGTVPC